jgi:hypothetical protein
MNLGVLLLYCQEGCATSFTRGALAVSTSVRSSASAVMRKPWPKEVRHE